MKTHRNELKNFLITTKNANCTSLWSISNYW